jgi:8-oxo-dGTP pyrophosphatase MutT (NUDIX family)
VTYGPRLLDGPPRRYNDVGALLVTDDGRYLAQLRDDRPDIRAPAHWGMFGGGIHPGESDEDALRRELVEELDLRVGELRRFTELVYVEPVPPHDLGRKVYLEARVTEREVAGLVQREGAARRFLTAGELLGQARVLPWDAFAVRLHAGCGDLFPAGIGWAAGGVGVDGPPPSP